ncbi:methyltransferase domain-containing protein [uncultured Lacinutrix sp.]|uniref:methyltransferase domain-containing protein n=1 Tax=uncultured Lacinutrix sp. TaxID=574032 RepID=UPI0026180B8A|nr:methyltransferase domain-containing protein [uncultured Lacinutrix sp.]
MSLLVNTKYRTNATEIMDDFSISGTILRDTLNKIDNINAFLGGNNVTINGLKKLLKNHPKEKPITIIDLGSGSGDILRNVAKLGKREGYAFNLIGIDANKDTTAYANELSINYPEIQFLDYNIFSETFKSLEFDIVLSTLFLHHFKENELHSLLSYLIKKATIGIVVNDLQRHKLAYYLFKLLCIPITNKMVIEDGLTSILRGFKRKELESISTKINANYAIKWKWAFRFQWILKRK